MCICLSICLSVTVFVCLSMQCSGSQLHPSLSQRRDNKLSLQQCLEAFSQK